jgi:hypothetical protein
VCVWVCVCDDFDSESALGLNPEVVTLTSGTLRILKSVSDSTTTCSCFYIILRQSLIMYANVKHMPVPVVPWSKASVCGRSLAGIVGSNPAGGILFSVCCECCVLSGRGLCVGLITRPEESCRLWCV